MLSYLEFIDVFALNLDILWCTDAIGVTTNAVSDVIGIFHGRSLDLICFPSRCGCEFPVIGPHGNGHSAYKEQDRMK